MYTRWSLPIHTIITLVRAKHILQWGIKAKKKKKTTTPYTKCNNHTTRAKNYKLKGEINFSSPKSAPWIKTITIDAAEKLNKS
jgi:hypothetical protein